MTSKIIYTKTDEAPALATYSLLPIIQAYTNAAGVEVETRDISLAGRVIASFPDYLTEEQRIGDALAELGEMAKTPERAHEFITELHAKASLKEAQEFELLKKELPEGVELVDGKMRPWDNSFVRATYKKKHFAIDERKVAEYFPMEKTVQGLFA
ncbi:MAG: NADP-dependent isocitrate dehydrogenase, partial [Pseudoalteromonas tetraodonis]|nr:NADP-dependent isocitrate dehydrogenase [Pseudoalteromonas tetraodonis]